MQIFPAIYGSQTFIHHNPNIISKIIFKKTKLGSNSQIIIFVGRGLRHFVIIFLHSEFRYYSVKSLLLNVKCILPGFFSISAHLTAA